MWRIRRIDVPHQSEVILECAPSETQGQVTLEEISTQTEATIQVCIPGDPGHTTDMLAVLSDAGFTPNDWE